MFLEPVWLARKCFPDGGVTRIESYGSDPVGGQCFVRCGAGRASASGMLWRMAVGAALFPCSPGGLPHPGLMVAY